MHDPVGQNCGSWHWQGAGVVVPGSPVVVVVGSAVVVVQAQGLGVVVVVGSAVVLVVVVAQPLSVRSHTSVVSFHVHLHRPAQPAGAAVVVVVVASSSIVALDSCCSVSQLYGFDWTRVRYSRSCCSSTTELNPSPSALVMTDSSAAGCSIPRENRR